MTPRSKGSRVDSPNKFPFQISIVIPAFNEERRLPPTLIDIIDFLDARGDSYEVIVVNDGSSDTTSAVVGKIQKLSHHIKLLEQPKNMGKGAAVKRGVLAATGAHILMADADGATPIPELMRLERALSQGADLAVGSRALHSKETKIKTSLHRKLMGRVFNGIVNLLLVPDIADTQCGFKLFTNRAGKFLFNRLRSERFSFDVELLFIAERSGMKIAEVPINWHNIPESKISLFKDSAMMFLDLLKFKMWHRSVTSAEWDAVKG